MHALPRLLLCAGVVVLASCDPPSNVCCADPTVDAAPDTAPIDSPPRPPRCDRSGAFGPPVRLTALNSPTREDLSVALTGDERTLYLVRQGATRGVIPLTSKRGTIAEEFPPPTFDLALAALTAADGNELYLYPSADNLAIYFRRTALHVATRPDLESAFTSGTEVRSNGAAVFSTRAIISADGETLYWSSPSAPLRAATRTGSPSNFTAERQVTTFEVTDFAISSDELTLYYATYPDADVAIATRASTRVPFDPGAPIASVNTTAVDVPLYVTPDDCFLYLRVENGPPGDLWITRRAD